MPGYPCKLSKEALLKAIDELNEPTDDHKRKQQIDALRTAFKTKYPNLKLVNEDDAFMIRFLRAKKYNQAKALETLMNYHVQRQEWPEMYEKINNPILVKHVLEKGVICPLQGRAKNGSLVMLMRPGLNKCNDMIEIVAAVNITVDKLLDEEDNQVYGVVVINDLAYLNMEIVKQMSPLLAMRFTKIMQESLPLRIKSVNFTNEPKIFDIMFAIVHPLLKEKLKKRLRLHGTDFTNLYEVVDKTNLPFMFAGKGPEPDVEIWKSKILEEGTAL